MEQKNFFEKFWYLFVIIALALMVVVATLWFNNQKILKVQQNQTNQPTEEIVSQPTPIPSDTATVNLENQSDSDEVSAIESDINATDLTDLDKEMADIEEEITVE